MSFSKSITFPEPPKSFKVSFVGPPPVAVSEKDDLVQQAYERGKSEAEAFYQNEISQLREKYAESQKSILSEINQKSDNLFNELDSRLPDLVIGIVERLLGHCPLDQNGVQHLVKSMISEFAEDDERLEVFLSPEDLKLLKSMADSEKAPVNEESAEDEGFASAIAGIFDGIDGDDALLDGFPFVKFFEDSSLESGDCQVKSRFGLLDGRISTKLRKVEEELKGHD